jgi:hypothetical protein
MAQYGTDIRGPSIDLAKAIVISTMVEKIRPILAGQQPVIQGAVLAGHAIEGDEPATNRLRETLLAVHVETVRELIPASVEQIERGQ